MRKTPEFAISIYLDSRRQNANGIFPLKIRVYAPKLVRTKFYTTQHRFSEKEYEHLTKGKKLNDEEKQLRFDIFQIENDLSTIAEKIVPFNFEDFARKLNLGKYEGSSIEYQYKQIIDHFERLGRFGNASNYNLSLKSLQLFVKTKRKMEMGDMPLATISPAFLKEYETFMVETLGRTRTTVSFYLRALRAVFNAAIRNNDIPSEVYPFGKGKYLVPAVTNVKKALTNDQLKKLFEAKPMTEEQEKAKDFWFFSYACNGMNVKDIALLKNGDVNDDRLVFYRAKTVNTASVNIPVTVYLNEYTLGLIKKYRTASENPKDYLFPILSKEASSIQNFKKIKNFTRFINQNFKLLAEQSEIKENVSTYWARHSFATNAIRKGASMEFISEALNHSSLKTTQGYFAGFENDAKKKLMDEIMKF